MKFGCATHSSDKFNIGKYCRGRKYKANQAILVTILVPIVWCYQLYNYSI